MCKVGKSDEEHLCGFPFIGCTFYEGCDHGAIATVYPSEKHAEAFKGRPHAYGLKRWRIAYIFPRVSNREDSRSLTPLKQGTGWTATP